MTTTLIAVALALAAVLAAPVAASAATPDSGPHLIAAPVRAAGHSATWLHAHGLSVRTRWVANHKASKLACLTGYSVAIRKDGVYRGCRFVYSHS